LIEILSNGGVMHENVIATRIRLNKAESFVREEFNSALCHNTFFPLVMSSGGQSFIFSTSSATLNQYIDVYGRDQGLLFITLLAGFGESDDYVD
jgi:hypothetical protein